MLIISASLFQSFWARSTIDLDFCFWFLFNSRTVGRSLSCLSSISSFQRCFSRFFIRSLVVCLFVRSFLHRLDRSRRYDDSDDQGKFKASSLNSTTCFPVHTHLHTANSIWINGIWIKHHHHHFLPIPSQLSAYPAFSPFVIHHSPYTQAQFCYPWLAVKIGFASAWGWNLLHLIA